MIRRPPRSTRVRSSAASDVYKRQESGWPRSLLEVDGCAALQGRVWHLDLWSQSPFSQIRLPAAYSLRILAVALMGNSVSSPASPGSGVIVLYVAVSVTVASVPVLPASMLCVLMVVEINVAPAMVAFASATFPTDT